MQDGWPDGQRHGSPDGSRQGTIVWTEVASHRLAAMVMPHRDQVSDLRDFPKVGLDRPMEIMMPWKIGMKL
jgi:hypothetical protein